MRPKATCESAGSSVSQETVADVAQTRVRMARKLKMMGAVVSTMPVPLTVRRAALLVTPEAEAVILEVSAVVPVFFPVARPAALIVAADALLEPQFRVMPDIVAPNWSLAVAVNCWVPLEEIEAAEGVMEMEVSTGVWTGGAVTVMVPLVLGPAAIGRPAGSE